MYWAQDFLKRHMAPILIEYVTVTSVKQNFTIAQSAGVVEYTDCFSVEG